MNKITESWGGLAFITDSGYDSQQDWPRQPGNIAFLEILDELGRVLTINGEADLARTTLEEAIKRTEASLADRSST